MKIGVLGSGVVGQPLADGPLPASAGMIAEWLAVAE